MAKRTKDTDNRQPSQRYLVGARLGGLIIRVGVLATVAAASARKRGVVGASIDDHRHPLRRSTHVAIEQKTHEPKGKLKKMENRKKNREMHPGKEGK